MATDFKLPEMGEGVNEGELVKWLVKEGDTVTHDQPLVEMMTDKATVEIPSPSTGKVVKLIAKEGDMVKVGQALLSIEGGAAAASAPAPKAAAQPQAAPQQAAAPARTAAPIQTGSAGAGVSVSGTGAGIYPPPAGANVLATPSTRRYARESGVDINQLPGSGPAGRVTREDVMKSMTTTGTGAVSSGAPMVSRAAIMPATSVANKIIAPIRSAGQNSEDRKPFRGIRKKIAENLVRSKQTIPHFTHVDEADVTELVKWRANMKEEAAQYGVKLTFRCNDVGCKYCPNVTTSHPTLRKSLSV